MKTYYPYISDKQGKKYYIITKDGKKVYFGAKGYEHYTITNHYKAHSDLKRRYAYENRHKKNENWKNPDTSGFWSYWFLWRYPNEVIAKQEINKYLKNKGYL